MAHVWTVPCPHIMAQISDFTTGPVLFNAPPNFENTDFGQLPHALYSCTLDRSGKLEQRSIITRSQNQVSQGQNSSLRGSRDVLLPHRLLVCASHRAELRAQFPTPGSRVMPLTAYGPC